MVRLAYATFLQTTNETSQVNIKGGKWAAADIKGGIWTAAAGGWPSVILLSFLSRLEDWLNYAS